MNTKRPPFLKKSEIFFFAFLGGVLALLLGISFLISGHRKAEPAPDAAAVEASAFDGVKITGKGAYVLDVRSGDVLYEKNADTRLPLASVTKVMTALVAKEIASDSTTVGVPEAAIEVDGDSGLFANERFGLKDLIDFSLTASSNDGMTAIAMSLGDLTSSSATDDERLADFVSQMNRKADALGMKDTYYSNVTGLDLSTTKAGAYGSAKDMTTLFAYVLKENPELLAATTNKTYIAVSKNGFRHSALNTDLVVGDIPGLLGSKTGATDLAGGNLVVAFDPEIGRPMIIAVLGSTEEGRFSDVLKLVTATMKAMSTRPAITASAQK